MFLFCSYIVGFPLLAAIPPRVAGAHCPAVSRCAVHPPASGRCPNECDEQPHRHRAGARFAAACLRRTGEPRGGSANFAEQPQATGSPRQCPPLRRPRPHPRRRALPLAGGQGQRALPHAWWQRQRRAARQSQRLEAWRIFRRARRDPPLSADDAPGGEVRRGDSAPATHPGDRPAPRRHHDRQQLRGRSESQIRHGGTPLVPAPPRPHEGRSWWSTSYTRKFHRRTVECYSRSMPEDGSIFRPDRAENGGFW